LIETNSKKERALLVAVAGREATRWEVQDFLDELSLLADTAGVEAVHRVVQERKTPDPAFFIGKGKAESIARMADELDAKLIIFDEDLTPAQTRNLENLFDKKVIDRSGLILDIFARRAKSREARTQVELAQLQYLLPRLTRQWTHLSRQVGGIGIRGPGETQLEVDRRLVRKRIAHLERDLQKIEKQRDLRRKRRNEMFTAALVGYTNVGKSTLMNALTDADVFIENRLFATLDATVRSMRLASHEVILLIDTVGFIRKLPHHLVASFKSTLEETRKADLLIHVVDLSHPRFEEQIETVNRVLSEMGLNGQKLLYIFNKIDAVESPSLVTAMRERYQPSVFVSATRGLFLDDVREKICEIGHEDEENLHITLRSADGEALARVHALSEVLEKQFDDELVRIQARTTREKADILRAFAKTRDATVESGSEPVAE